ncbi:hypothetical protein C8J56DRAFT_511430 [Mycena floridula]|nr:hypothetical protein C8J56DRAFT_511430 [Mycena floridula]
MVFMIFLKVFLDLAPCLVNLSVTLAATHTNPVQVFNLVVQRSPSLASFKFMCGALEPDIGFHWEDLIPAVERSKLWSLEVWKVPAKGCGLISLTSEHALDQQAVKFFKCCPSLERLIMCVNDRKDLEAATIRRAVYRVARDGNGPSVRLYGSSNSVRSENENYKVELDLVDTEAPVVHHYD